MSFLMFDFLHFVEGFIAFMEGCFDLVIPERDDFSVLLIGALFLG
jgi:hypothetical protein